MTRFAAIHLLGCLTLTACGVSQSTDEGAASNAHQPSLASYQRDFFSGYDRHGVLRTCSAIPPQTFCTMIYGPDEVFAAACRDKGFETFQCGCHDYLCKEPIQVGR